jgi:hypothetical protein
MDRLAPERSATLSAARQRPLTDGENFGGEVSFGVLLPDRAYGRAMRAWIDRTKWSEWDACRRHQPAANKWGNFGTFPLGRLEGQATSTSRLGGRGHDRLWHLADITRCLTHVRFQGNSGQQMPNRSFSALTQRRSGGLRDDFIRACERGGRDVEAKSLGTRERP